MKKTPFVAFEIPYELRRDGRSETGRLRLVVTGAPVWARGKPRAAVPHVIETLRGADALGVPIWKAASDTRGSILPEAGPLNEAFAFLLDHFLQNMTPRDSEGSSL
jgi:hypothetical protein